MISRRGSSPPERGGPESIAADALVLGCIPAVAGVLGPLQCHSLEGRWPPVILPVATPGQNETVAVIEIVRGAPSHAAFSVMADR